MNSKTFRVERSILNRREFALEEVPLSGGHGRTLSLLTAAQLEDLFWVLARHLSRTEDDEAASAVLAQLTEKEN